MDHKLIANDTIRDELWAQVIDGSVKSKIELEYFLGRREVKLELGYGNQRQPNRLLVRSDGGARLRHA